METKKEWKKPELIVLTRRSSDENVLLGCKASGQFSCLEEDNSPAVEHTTS
jgi:hypothetical protein